jgi:hypothetical protein
MGSRSRDRTPAILLGLQDIAVDSSPDRFPHWPLFFA